MKDPLPSKLGRFESGPAGECITSILLLVPADNVSVALGYDAGVKSAFATATNDSTVNGRSVRASATWFQKGNHVRTEGTVHIDGRSSLWGS